MNVLGPYTPFSFLPPILITTRFPLSSRLNLLIPQAVASLFGMNVLGPYTPEVVGERESQRQFILISWLTSLIAGIVFLFFLGYLRYKKLLSF
jgi:hypothetical protein